MVSWDIEFNRPIVDGKIAHPITGEIQQAGRQGVTDGPPSIEIRMFNVNSNINIRMITKSSPVSLEKLYLAVARHVHDGIYKLISINASSYTFIIVCQIQVSAEDFNIAWKNMYSKKADFKYTDEEWDAWLETNKASEKT